MIASLVCQTHSFSAQSNFFHRNDGLHNRTRHSFSSQLHIRRICIFYPRNGSIRQFSRKQTPQLLNCSNLPINMEIPALRATLYCTVIPSQNISVIITTGDPAAPRMSGKGSTNAINENLSLPSAMASANVTLPPQCHPSV